MEVFLKVQYQVIIHLIIAMYIFIDNISIFPGCEMKWLHTIFA